MEKGNITFSTALDNKQLEKDYQQAVKTVQKLEDDLQKNETQQTGLEQELEEINQKALEAKRAIEALHEKQKELETVASGEIRIGSNPMEQVEAMTAAQEELDQIPAKLKEATAAYETQVKASDKLVAKLGAVEEKHEQITAAITEQKVKAAELGQEMTAAVDNAKLSSALSGAQKTFGRFFTRVGTMMKKVFAFSVILAGLRAIKSYLGEAIEQNAEAQHAIGSLKGALDALAQPILGVLIPAFTKLVTVLAVMVGYVARAVNALFGTMIKRTDAAAKSAKKESKAITGIGKAAKGASRYLAAFDELNQTSGGTDTGSTGSADMTSPLDEDAGKINWDAFDPDKISDKLKEITAIVAVACLAVGAILTFSGINIPLGITLMVIGALMMYEIVRENWDKLPREMQQSITGLLVILGLALFAVGAILAFSGANIPLGIGMMVAGALLLYTAITLNWDLLPANIQATITSVMVILGLALVVVGAILAFSGAALPLGIGLIALGAGTLGAAAALNWDTLKPLIEENLTKILGIGGVLMLVIGLLLCFTGVALPLGIALIAAGGFALTQAIARVDWGFLQQKFAEVWNGIKTWFQANVAPKFTAGFWLDKFSAIGDGLKEAIKNAVNGGIALFNAFIDWLNAKLNISWDGINIGGKQIVEPASFQLLKIPHIPMLASGAVIPPNREFAAVLGDQSSGMNIEAPEDLIRQIVREESGNAELVTLLSSILQAVRDGHNIYVDKRILGRVASEQIGNMTRMGGAY